MSESELHLSTCVCREVEAGPYLERPLIAICNTKPYFLRLTLHFCLTQQDSRHINFIPKHRNSITLLTILNPGG